MVLRAPKTSGPIPPSDARAVRALRYDYKIARMDQMTAQLDGLIGKEAREALPTLRDGAALEISRWYP